MSDLPPRISVREERALQMLRSGVRAAEGRTKDEFLVPSESGKGFYRVRGVGLDFTTESCECDDFLERQAPCKHILFVRLWTRDPPLDLSQLPPRPKGARRTPRPPRYTESQTEEGRLFPILLRELCAGVPDPIRDPHSAGRPPIPLRDQVFCAVQKVYSGFSGRRSQTHRVGAAEAGQIDSVPYWDVVSKFLCRPESTPLLMDILARSVIPFRALETRCAIDSTGFRTTRFHYYRNEKYNPARKNIWLKAHALVGVRTHAVIAIEISEGTAGDAPRFPVLLRRAKDAGFGFKEILADRAYNSRDNFEVADELGIVALIPFKSNQTGQAKGSPAYHRMFNFFAYHREKFDEHYRDRAQVESAFGSIKQKMDETIQSRKFDAQVNELLCKLIAHNITMLIQAMFGIGILPDFLQPSERPSHEQLFDAKDLGSKLLSFNPSEVAPPVVLSAPPR